MPGTWGKDQIHLLYRTHTRGKPSHTHMHTHRLAHTYVGAHTHTCRCMHVCTHSHPRPCTPWLPGSSASISPGALRPLPGGRASVRAALTGGLSPGYETPTASGRKWLGNACFLDSEFRSFGQRRKHFEVLIEGDTGAQGERVVPFSDPNSAPLLTSPGPQQAASILGHADLVTVPSTQSLDALGVYTQDLKIKCGRSNLLLH